VRKICAHPGCRAAVLTQKLCSRHRPRVRKPDEPRAQETVEQRRVRKQRRAREHLAAGCLFGGYA
jgi:hypothetical protein